MQDVACRFSPVRAYARPFACISYVAPSSVDDWEPFFSESIHENNTLTRLPPREPDNFVITLLEDLDDCNILSRVRTVHDKLCRGGHECIPFVANRLIQTYGDFRCIQEAQATFDETQRPNGASWAALLRVYRKNGDFLGAKGVFDEMPSRDVVAWSSMMSLYTQHKQAKEALELFYQMHSEGIVPDMFIYACAIDACAFAEIHEDGKVIHSAVVSTIDNLHVVVGTALVGFYGKSSSVWDARKVFQGIQNRDTICWNTMITVFVQNCYEKEGLYLFFQMQLEGIKPDSMTYMRILHACANTASVLEGKRIHAVISGAELELHIPLSTALLNMYGKCGDVLHAVSIFNGLSHHDTISSTAMISAFSQSGYSREALQCFLHMQYECIKPDRVTFICLLDACASLNAVKGGFEVHAAIIDSEHAEDTMIGFSLFNMYIKFSCIFDAERVFDRLSVRDELGWNTMFRAFSDCNYHKRIISRFFQLLRSGVKPNDSIYSSAINACISLSAFEEGEVIHTAIVENHDDHHLGIVSALINMYGEKGRVQDARKIFEALHSCDIVCWNVMMSTLLGNRHFRDALILFYQMEQSGFTPSEVSFMCALDACKGLISLKDGLEIHATIVKRGETIDMILANALINFYGKCGSPTDAKKIFSDIRVCCDVVCCTSMMVALIDNQLHEEVLDLLSDMLYRGISLDIINYVCILTACSSLAVVDLGFVFHAAAVEMCFDQDLLIGTGVMNVYGKCGAVTDAHKVFSTFSYRDIGTWNAMLGVFAHNGNEHEVKRLLKQLEFDVAEPDYKTLVAVYVAYGHAGMVDDGWQFFYHMKNKHRLLPQIEHFVCMIDILGRAGQLNDAGILIGCMPFQKTSVAWRSLLTACIRHGNREHGECVAKFCFELGVSDDAPYVMLSNMYAILGSGDDDFSSLFI